MSNTKPDFTGMIAHLERIARMSADNLLTEGPVHVDHRLLELCADVGSRYKVAEAAYQRHRAGWKPAWEAGTEDAKAAMEKLTNDCRNANRAVSNILREAAKLRATTPAGIFAKAIAVRSSRSGAAKLGLSLAQDLLDCPGLRAALWPAGEAPTTVGGE